MYERRHEWKIGSIIKCCVGKIAEFWVTRSYYSTVGGVKLDRSNLANEWMVSVAGLHKKDYEKYGNNRNKGR